ncbi:hypothetical protein NDU88_001978 [Pleurodeles waltl]|uniref:Uncharacterized protein n=1 Tax=Pleurodeles waltl TaxID=8319 RepID=A0AAV7TJB7_PLEWA|nr:hypothetical protein NDU88_001978 [Pleurodeles waltl]
MLHNLALQRQVPFLQEGGPDGGVLAAVEPVDSEGEEAEEEDINNRNTVIYQYFQCVYLELSNVVVFSKCVCILSVAVCTANGIPWLKDRCVD